MDCYTPANGETATIVCAPSIPLDVSLPLLKAEARTYNLLPPDPKRQRILHGVLVMKDNVSNIRDILMGWYFTNPSYSSQAQSMCLMDVDAACREAGITRHIVRFTSTITLDDPGPASKTAEKLQQLIKG